LEILRSKKGALPARVNYALSISLWEFVEGGGVAFLLSNCKHVNFSFFFSLRLLALKVLFWIQLRVKEMQNGKKSSGRQLSTLFARRIEAVFLLRVELWPDFSRAQTLPRLDFDY
jgi:hypothetical protein